MNPKSIGTSCALALCSACYQGGGPTESEPVERVVVHDGQVVVEGDILLGPVDSVQDESDGAPRKSVGLANQSHGDNSGVESVVYSARLWRDGVIPYRFDKGMTQLEKAWVEKAINIYHQRTSLRWVRRDNASIFSNHVVFSADNGIGGTPMSFIGDWKLAYAQHVWLGWGLYGVEACDDPFSEDLVCPTERELETIIHEMGHAVGLWHEQQHRERGRWDGTWESHSGSFEDAVNDQVNFDIAQTSHGLTELDWESIMLYHGVFEPTDEHLQNPYEGQNYVLSEGDVRGIEIMYGRPLEPVADTVRVEGQLHVFAKFKDGRVGHLRKLDGRWEPVETWDSPADWVGVGYVKGSPEASVLADGRIGLFARGPFDQLLVRAYDTATDTWQGEGWNGLSLTDPDGEPVDIRSHIEVAPIQGAGALLYFLDRAQNLRAFVCQDSEPDWACYEVDADAPRARSISLDRGLLPVVVDVHGRPKVFDGNAWTGVCEETDPAFIGVAGRLAVVGDVEKGDLDLLGRDGDGNLVHCARRHGDWSQWNVLPMDAGSPPVAERSASGEVRYWVRAASGKVLQGYCFFGGCGAGTPLRDTEIFGAPVVLPSGEDGVPGDLLVRDTDNRLQSWARDSTRVLARGKPVRW